MKHESIDKYIINNELDLDAIIDSYTHYVNKVINNMVGNNLNVQDKEEILIDTFFNLWKNYKNKKTIEVPDSYLAGIAKNLTKNKLRSNKKLVNFDDIEVLEKYSIYDNYNEDNYIIDLLYQSISKLEKRDQDIIKLYYYSSKSINEIAEILKYEFGKYKNKIIQN